MAQPQFVLVTFPIQGHINPALQLAKCLIRTGVRVTFVTTISTIRRMTKVPAAQGLSFSPFSDGYDYGVKPGDDPVIYLSEFRRRGKEALSDLIITNENEAKPVTCIIYTLFQPWATEVAREYHIPSALLCIQPATVFDIYYFYFNGYDSAIKDQADESNPECLIKLPGLLPLAAHDLPSFFASSNVYQWGLSTFQEQMEVLAEEPNAKILINTFDALEPAKLSR